MLVSAADSNEINAPGMNSLFGAVQILQCKTQSGQSAI